MPYEFEAPKIKLRRAAKHLNELEKAIEAYVASGPAKFESRIFDPDDGRQCAEISLTVTGPPPETAAMIGDVVHNLRSALDLTACEPVRVRLGPSVRVDDVYFPFARRCEDFDLMIRNRNFDRAGHRAVELIREFKPYAGGNAALRAIHDLDIQDKHTALIPTVMNVGGPVLRRWDDDGTPNLSFIGDPNSPSEVKVVFPPNISLAGQEIIPALHDLVELATSIVEAFCALAYKC
ncbi:MAG: hypothetical protein ACRD2G_19140 [Terriglobia bacterium]